ncbi:MAG: RHS repeat-associated core domain-containing protein [Polyangiaceae bacterium]|nr:RHS repeat-associated core domain-containing protein [Polyangiaceae bacterium]
MVRFGARDYDPETGTWLTPEPLGFAAGDNFYAYAAGNPVAYNDPTGLAPSRAELTFLAELFGVGSTASMINERDASIEAVSHGDIGKAECHAAAAASASVGAVVEIGMLAATRGGGARQTGSYTNLHKSGKKYHGKGPRSRSQKSGRRVERETGDPHIGTEWSPASSEREAFKQESRRIDQDGGWDSPLNYNRKESPGKRLRRDDGEFP